MYNLYYAYKNSKILHLNVNKQLYCYLSKLLRIYITLLLLLLLHVSIIIINIIIAFMKHNIKNEHQTFN